MKELSITEIVRKPAEFKEALINGPVRITWKEPKPNGKQVFSATAKRDNDNV